MDSRICEWTSIAVQENGTGHISYDTSDSVRYATDAAGPWATRPVDVAGRSAYTSIALDSYEYPRISYIDSCGGARLRYAVWEQGVWTIETVDSIGSGDLCWTSLALDDDDNPHITYIKEESPSGDLIYAFKGVGGWTFDTVDTATFLASLALDSHGMPHIAYHYRHSWDLRYAVGSDEGFHVGGGAGSSSTARLERPYPNPVGQMTDVRFEMYAPGRATVRIYDLAGRLVRTLTDADHSPGKYTVQWDGNDGSGRRVPSGVYFCRLSLGEFRATRKLMVLR